MLIACAVGSSDTVMKAVESLFGAAKLRESLGGHLITRHVVWIVFDERVELGKRGVGVALIDVFDSEAVASEGVCRIELKDFRERGDLVHSSMVRCLW